MQRFNRLHVWVLVLVILVAAVLRFAGLGHIPAGLYRDEAFYGLDAVNVLRGQHAIYFPANNGREPMFVYLLALSIGVLGRSPLAVRLPAALISLLTVPATYLMARELFGKRVGLFSAAVMAVTLWPVHLGHVGFRVGLLPLFVSFTVWHAARGWKLSQLGHPDAPRAEESLSRGKVLRFAALGDKSTQHWITAGILYGLSFYTYLAVRFTPLVIAVFIVYVWFAHPRVRAALIKAVMPFGTSALIVIVPLAIYAIGHWDIIMGRGGQVSILNPVIGGPNPWFTSVSNTARALGMFFWHGDFSARQNLPYRPVFDPLMSLCFIAGVIIALVRARRDAACMLALIWTGVMLLPTILAEDAPHFLRAVGVLPIVAVFPVLALDTTLNFKPQISNLKLWRSPLRLDIGYLVFALLAMSLTLTSYDYFVRYARDESVKFWFDDAGVQMAAEINRFTGAGWGGGEWIVSNKSPAADHHVFMDRGLWAGFVNTQFLVPDHSALTFIETVGDLPASGTGPILLLLWPYEDWRRDLALLPRLSMLEFREGALSKGDKDKEPIVTYLVIRAEPYTSLPQPLARFWGGAQLVSAQVDGARVRLTWYVPQTPDADYAVFVHIQRDGVLIAQRDGDPASGLYPMSRWRPGDVVVDEHPLSGTWDARRDHLLVGLYRRDTGTRLPIVDAAGKAIGDSVTINK